MKLNRILFAASASLATMLILSCGDHDGDLLGLPLPSSGSVMELSSSGGNTPRSSAKGTSSSSSVDALLSSSSSDGGLVACGLHVACPSSSSSAEDAPSSSSLTQCGGKLYIPSDELRCENDVIETKCGIGWYDATNQRCGAHNVVETECGSGWFNAANQRCGAGDVIETKCGSGWYDAASGNFRCHNSVIETKCGEDSWYDASDSNQKCENDVVKTPCGVGWISIDNFCFEGTAVPKCGERTEIFDPALYECRYDSKIYLKEKVKDAAGNEYEAVLIGKQTWIAENLNYNVSGNFCLGQWGPNCDIYGRLYNWTTTLMVCPSGWHIPSNAEWDELMTTAGGEKIAGAILKASERWDALKPYVGVDYYGFSALPGSHGEEAHGYPAFSKAGEDGYWWSADEPGTNTPFAYYLKMEANQSGMYRTYASKAFLFSVRCVKD